MTSRKGKEADGEDEIAEWRAPVLTEHRKPMLELHVVGITRC